METEKSKEDDKKHDLESYSNEELVISNADTEHEISSAYRIISEIIKQNKTACWPFIDPVDVKGLGLWDYEVKIKHAMCLNMILEKFNNNQYRSFSDVASDFRLMVENCYRYNTTEHPISKKAKRLEMIFESKLALLTRDIQDKSTIAKTSNGRFATKLDNNTIAKTRDVNCSLNNGSFDNSFEFNDQLRLVYDFVRCEETAVAEDKKLTSCRERKQQQALYQRIAAVFVSSLEAKDDMKVIKTCHLLPEIGLFLHLNETYFRLPELTMYNLEMGLLIPEHSLYLARIMTSFLCTYYERCLIAQRPPMSFSIWNKRLKQKLDKWFETASKCYSFSVAADKLFINVDFYQAMCWKNPFDTNNNTFLSLSYIQRAQILKALCDSQTALQGVQNNLVSCSADQMRPMNLGEDLYGNKYIYFPQFCGEDLRIYRHLQHGVYDFVDCPMPEVISNKTNTKDASSAEHKNALCEKQAFTNETTSEISKVVLQEILDCVVKACRNLDIPALKKQESIIFDKTESILDFDCPIKGSRNHDNVDACCTHAKPNGLNRVPLPNKQQTQNNQRKKKCKSQLLPETTPSVRRSSRKRTTVNYSKMMVEGDGEEVESDKSSKTPQKPRSKQKSFKHSKNTTERMVTSFGTVKFEMVCDSVEELRKLISSMQEENDKAISAKMPSSVVMNVKNLIERLKWLLIELEPWELRLEKSRFDAKIRVKKEHDEILRCTTTGNAVLSPDAISNPWEEEIANKSSLVTSENCSTNRVPTPNSLYVEESEEESDPEIRRSRRKPRRYEVDEDYVVCDSSDNDASSPTFPNEFMYDEFNEGRKRLMPAALHQLEMALTDQTAALVKLMARGRLGDLLDKGSATLNDRRTRQRSKQQIKLFRRILALAHKSCTEEGPSLLPLIRSDQVEITDVVDRVLANEAIIREQRKVVREQEKRRKLAVKQAIQQQRKKELKRQRLDQRVPSASNSKVLKSATKESMWTSPKRSSVTNVATSTNCSVAGGNAVENVVIRLQNGKVCPALRFTDGRIAPIVRVDSDAKPAASFDDLTAGIGKSKQRIVNNKVPYISLSGTRRRAVPSILNKPSAVKTPTVRRYQMSIDQNQFGNNLNTKTTLVKGSCSYVQRKNVSQATVTTNHVPIMLTQNQEDLNKHITKVNKTSVPPYRAVSSSKMINLVLSPSRISQQLTTSNPSTNFVGPAVENLGKFVVKVNPRLLSPAPTVDTLTRPSLTRTYPKHISNALSSAKIDRTDGNSVGLCCNSVQSVQQTVAVNQTCNLNPKSPFLDPPQRSQPQTEPLSNGQTISQPVDLLSTTLVGDIGRSESGVAQERQQVIVLPTSSIPVMHPVQMVPAVSSPVVSNANKESVMFVPSESSAGQAVMANVAYPQRHISKVVHSQSQSTTVLGSPGHRYTFTPFVSKQSNPQ